MNIKEIANEINSLASNYKIGNLQNIRKQLKSLKRKPGSKIFRNATIDKKGEWAFHYGGRSELQFNIGFENEIFRYGVAFSLEPSHTLPNIEVLFPKIDRFNLYLKFNPFILSEMQMWYYDINGRSKNSSVNTITNELKKNHTFIFIGKYLSKETIENTKDDFKNVLETFDDLLDYTFLSKTKTGKRF